MNRSGEVESLHVQKVVMGVVRSIGAESGVSGVGGAKRVTRQIDNEKIILPKFTLIHMNQA